MGLIIVFTECNKDQQIYNIKDYGARGDSSTLNTQSIQKAIDEAVSQGGGTVFVFKGDYITGSIELKSNITLHIRQNASFIASTAKDNRTFGKGLPEMRAARSEIAVQNVENLNIDQLQVDYPDYPIKERWRFFEVDNGWNLNSYFGETSSNWSRVK